MKRWLLYIGIFVVAFSIPLESADVGKLRPVQVVSMYRQGEEVVIETDTEDRGKGETVDAAFEDLEITTPAIIYLDTADYLLVTEDVLEQVNQLDEYLKDNVKICCQEVPVDTKLAAQYLSAQGDLPRLKEWTQGAEIPVLGMKEEKIFLIEKSKNNA